jgi:hypothetical protein
MFAIESSSGLVSGLAEAFIGAEANRTPCMEDFTARGRPISES